MIFKLTDELLFPPPVLARDDGLLAVGGDLSIDRLLLAYRMGIFPWFSAGDPILWWSPDPRLILELAEFHCSKRLARIIRQGKFTVKFDSCFADVVACCSEPRGDGGGTWIVPEMKEAYLALHHAGWAHSVECFVGDELVGGLYGVSIGGVFFGESMFARVANASKVSFAFLVEFLREEQFDFIDCQLKTDHLVSLGAREVTGLEFASRLRSSCQRPSLLGQWQC